MKVIDPGERCLETYLQASSKTSMKLVEQKAFCLVNKKVQAQWQAKFAFLKACWMCVIMVWGHVGLLSHSSPPFATTTSSLDLCPLPHLNLQGHEVEMSRPSMVISLKLYLFHISDLFLK